MRVLALAVLLPLLATLAPAAGALGLPRASVEVDVPRAPATPLEIDVAAPALTPAPEMPDAPAVVIALPEVPRLEASLPLPLPPIDAPEPSSPPAILPGSPITFDPRVHVASAAPVGSAPPAAVAAGGAALLWLLVERLGVGRALLALYFRVQPGELLENERRERVITLVRERPGIGPSEIAHDLGTGWGVTSYHLDRLERAGLVASQRVGNHRCYFVPGAVPREAQHAVGLFRADTTRRVAKLVAERPGIGQTELCQELGLSASAASKQLSKLEGASLLRREASGNGLRLYPMPQLASAAI